jgi:hypothetical protein
VKSNSHKSTGSCHGDDGSSPSSQNNLGEKGQQPSSTSLQEEMDEEHERGIWADKVGAYEEDEEEIVFCSVRNNSPTDTTRTASTTAANTSISSSPARSISTTQTTLSIKDASFAIFEAKRQGHYRGLEIETLTDEEILSIAASILANPTNPTAWKDVSQYKAQQQQQQQRQFEPFVQHEDIARFEKSPVVPPNVVIHSGGHGTGFGGGYMGRMESEVTLDMPSIEDDRRDSAPRRCGSGSRGGLLNRGGTFVPHAQSSCVTGGASRWSNGVPNGNDCPMGNHVVGGSSRTLSSVSSVEDDMQPRRFRRCKMEDVNETNESIQSTTSAQGSKHSAITTPVSIKSPPRNRGKEGKTQEDYETIITSLREAVEGLPHETAKALKTFASLELDADEQDVLAALGAPALIVEAMLAHGGTLDVQRQGCTAIWNLTASSSAQVALLESGCLDAVLEAAATFTDSVDLQLTAMATLSMFAANRENLDILMEKGAAESIIKIMNNHSEDPIILKQGCQAIGNLASHISPFKRKIMELGAGTAVVVAMVTYQDDCSMQEQAMIALRNLCTECEQNKVDTAEFGAIDALISSMQLHREAAGVQEEGARLISSLAGASDNTAAIGDGCGLDVLVRAMWVHSEIVGIQEWCCRALLLLTLDCQNARNLVEELDGVSAIVNSMQAFPDNAVVQLMGCGALANLAGFDNDIRMKIVDQAALDAITFAMVLHTDDVQIQVRGCSALLNLAIPENMKPMVAANVVELVQGAALKYPRKCGDYADQLISAFENAAMTN